MGMSEGMLLMSNHQALFRTEAFLFALSRESLMELIRFFVFARDL